MTGRVEIVDWLLHGGPSSGRWVLTGCDPDGRKVGMIVWTAEKEWIWQAPWVRRQDVEDLLRAEACSQAEALGVPPPGRRVPPSGRVEIVRWSMTTGGAGNRWVLRGFDDDGRKVAVIEWTATVAEWIWVAPWARRQGLADRVWDEAVAQAEAVGVPPPQDQTNWAKLTSLGKKWAVAVDPPDRWREQREQREAEARKRRAEIAAVVPRVVVPPEAREAAKAGASVAEVYRLIREANRLG